MRAIGVVNLNQRVDRHGIAEMALLIGEPDAWGQGFGTESRRLMLGYALTCWGSTTSHWSSTALIRRHRARTSALVANGSASAAARTALAAALTSCRSTRSRTASRYHRSKLWCTLVTLHRATMSPLKFR